MEQGNSASRFPCNNQTVQRRGLVALSGAIGFPLSLIRITTRAIEEP